jgi:hypothetical protein
MELASSGKLKALRGTPFIIIRRLRGAHRLAGKLAPDRARDEGQGSVGLGTERRMIVVGRDG